MHTNIRLYPWFQFFRSLLFWQGIWFLYFQDRLGAGEAMLLYAVNDITTTVLEVPSGYLSDRAGRRVTLILALLAMLAGCLLLAAGNSLVVLALGQVALGAGGAFISGTDTSLLFESLLAEGRSNETEAHEMRAWRFTFTALALSAVTGGALAARRAEWAFLASALAAAAAMAIAWRFREPGHPGDASAAADIGDAAARAARRRVLAWFFCLAVGMYVLSHVPYVFGQPFILEALATVGLAGHAPIVSGSVSAAMMLVSVAASWGAAPLDRAIGRGGVYLTALAMQIGLIGLLAATNSPVAIAFLLLRMVPDSLARPFMLARLHRLLPDRSRATYLSVQSLCGRLILAASLIAFSVSTGEANRLPYGEIRFILVWYLGGGLVLLAALAATVRYARDVR